MATDRIWKRGPLPTRGHPYISKDKHSWTGGTPPPPSGENPPPTPEPQPDNVKDPFEETPPPPPDKGEYKDKDKEGDDKEGDDKENDDDFKEQTPPNGIDKEGKDKGEDKDKGGDKDGSGKGADVDEDSTSKDGEGSDSEFGDDDSEIQSLEEMLKKIKDDFDSGKSTKDIQTKQDLDILENVLSTPKDQIKNIFRSKAVVMSAIGKRNIFSR